jgi:hypothetical protein
MNEIWKEKQVFLFGLIKTQIPKNRKFTDVIEEALGIDTDAVYRRINGKTNLGVNELYVLCKKFNISMDRILNYATGQDILFQYSAVSPDSVGYVSYFQQLSEILTGLTGYSKSVADRELLFTASDIPFHHFLNCPELLYFKLYVWHNILNEKHIAYTDFCNQLDRNLITSICKQMEDVYMQIPSKEIWSVHTIYPMLQLLRYYAGTSTFKNNKGIIPLLFEQLTNIINTMEKDACKGHRGDKATSFYLYISPTNIENDIMLVRNVDKFNCCIELFTVNRLFTGDEHICSDIYKKMNDLISKSMLVSTRLELERCRFFQAIRNKMESLIIEIRKRNPYL